MAIIALEGIHFYGYHGFYEEERITGNHYVIDVYVDSDTDKAAEDDNLYATVNYETVYLICQMEMRKPSKLLETLAQNIMGHLNGHFETLLGIKVRITKLHPPLGGRVDSAYVELSSGNFDASFSHFKSFMSSRGFSGFKKR